MSQTHTNTKSDSKSETYTEADVKAVMRNSYEDIIGFANAGIINFKSAKQWIEDLIFILNKKILRYFEVQLYDSNGNWITSYKYEAVVGYNLLTSSSSGGIDYSKYPKGTYGRLFADYDTLSEVGQEVNRILHEERGWGYGKASTGIVEKERSYVSGVLSLNRSIIRKQ